MIRTDAVQLTVIPAAAYRQKLYAGGSGIVIVRGGGAQPGIASISKTSGEFILAANTPADLYPPEAFQEAMKLTAGLPYRKQGAVRYEGGAVKKVKEKVPEEVSKEVAEEEVFIDGYEYKAVVAVYTDKEGRLSYDLLNKDLIRFSYASSVARAMIADLKPLEDIRLYITGTKFRNITGNRKLTDAQVLKISGLLDEVSPKGVYKALNAELKARLKKAKK